MANAELEEQVAEAEQSARAARESDARLTFALNASQMGTWDLDLMTLEAHRTDLHDRIFGYETMLPEWSYELFLDHVHPDDRQAVDEKCRTTMSTGVPWNFECRVVWRDGSVHWIAAESELHQDVHGRPVRLFGSVQDITEHTEARLAAEEANAAKSTFLAAMSHELRTPLNAIGGYAELLELELRGPITVAQRLDLDRIKRSQQHLLRMVNEVLSFAKIDAGQVKYDQILLNLLANAIKFTNPGGRVRMWCAGVDSRVHIHVRDSGPGIPDDDLERSFEPFVQIDRRLNRPAEGTGLGLAISRELARGMGGDVEVASEPGKGSTFTLVLPASTDKRPRDTKLRRTG